MRGPVISRSGVSAPKAAVNRVRSRPSSMRSSSPPCTSDTRRRPRQALSERLPHPNVTHVFLLPPSWELPPRTSPAVPKRAHVHVCRRIGAGSFPCSSLAASARAASSGPAGVDLAHTRLVHLGDVVPPARAVHLATATASMTTRITFATALCLLVSSLGVGWGAGARSRLRARGRGWSRATELDPTRAAREAGGEVQVASHFIPIDRQDALPKLRIDAKAEYLALYDALIGPLKSGDSEVERHQDWDVTLGPVCCSLEDVLVIPRGGFSESPPFHAATAPAYDPFSTSI